VGLLAQLLNDEYSPGVEIIYYEYPDYGHCDFLWLRTLNNPSRPQKSLNHAQIGRISCFGQVPSLPARNRLNLNSFK
jgi:hypothetical protein